MIQDHHHTSDITDTVRRVFKLKDNLLKLRYSFINELGQDKRSQEDQRFIAEWQMIAKQSH